LLLLLLLLHLVFICSNISLEGIIFQLQAFDAE
jgi:uncharacterized protein (UPF0212 family)